MTAFSIQANSFGKRYFVAAGQKGAGRHWPGVFRNSRTGPLTEFWALRDVSFSISPGEAVGIIGRNGAGKSTLLKLLSRITAPSEGSARIRGRVSTLLRISMAARARV